MGLPRIPSIFQAHNVEKLSARFDGLGFRDSEVLGVVGCMTTMKKRAWLHIPNQLRVDSNCACSVHHSLVHHPHTLLKECTVHQGALAASGRILG